MWLAGSPRAVGLRRTGPGFPQGSPDKQPGDVLTLVVASVNEQKKEMSFKAT